MTALERGSERFQIFAQSDNHLLQCADLTSALVDLALSCKCNSPILRCVWVLSEHSLHSGQTLPPCIGGSLEANNSSLQGQVLLDYYMTAVLFYWLALHFFSLRDKQTVGAGQE